VGDSPDEPSGCCGGRSSGEDLSNSADFPALWRDISSEKRTNSGIGRDRALLADSVPAAPPHVVEGGKWIAHQIERQLRRAFARRMARERSGQGARPAFDHPPRHVIFISGNVTVPNWAFPSGWPAPGPRNARLMGPSPGCCQRAGEFLFRAKRELPLPPLTAPLGLNELPAAHRPRRL